MGGRRRAPASMPLLACCGRMPWPGRLPRSASTPQGAGCGALPHAHAAPDTRPHRATSRRLLQKHFLKPAAELAASAVQARRAVRLAMRFLQARRPSLVACRGARPQLAALRSRPPSAAQHASAAGQQALVYPARGQSSGSAVPTRSVQRRQRQSWHSVSSSPASQDLRAVHICWRACRARPARRKRNEHARARRLCGAASQVLPRRCADARTYNMVVTVCVRAADLPQARAPAARPRGAVQTAAPASARRGRSRRVATSLSRACARGGRWGAQSAAPDVWW